MPSQQELFIIDLDKTREADAFPLDATNLHYEQIGQAVRCISEVFSRIPISGEKMEREKLLKLRVHETIAIFGKRGVGKTSLLLSLQENDSTHIVDGLQGADFDLFNKLEPLRIIDPTLMGRNENLLSLLIKHIRTSVNKHLCDDAKDCTARVNQNLIDDWKGSYRKLGQGIAEVEQLGAVDAHRQEWYDPAIAFEKNMAAIEYGCEIEEELKNFVCLSLEILAKKAFLVFLDDMDTRPQACWPILECIRKYFTTPQLITVISGDLDLFSIIVRNKMLEQFQITPQAQYNSFDTRSSNLIEGLVDQYLLKLLPNRNRITLQNFYTSAARRLSGRDISEQVALRRFANQSSLQEWMKRLHSALGLHYPHYRQLYGRALFDTPLRTFRQVCDAIINAFHQPLGGEKREPVACYKTLMRHLADIFQNQLYQFGYSNYTVELEALKTPSGIGDLLDKLVMGNLLDTQDDLSPACRHHATRMAFLVIQAHLTAAFIEAPSAAFHYLLKISMLKQVSMFAGYALHSESSYLPVRDHLRLESETMLYSTGQYLSSISWSSRAGDDKPRRFGSVLVAVASDMTFTTREAISILHPTALPGKGNILISIFSFIGLIGDVLEADSGVKQGELWYSLKSDNTLFPFQGESGDQAIYMGDTFSKLFNRSSKSEEFASWYSLKMSNYLNKWRVHVLNFLSHPDTDTISAGVFSGVAKRFSDGLRQLDYVFAPKEGTVKEYLKSCAVLFLNAVLVEEALRTTNAGATNFNFPVSSPTALYENLLSCIGPKKNRMGTHLHRSYPLFSIVASFPLWGIFDLHGDMKLYCRTNPEVYIWLREIFYPYSEIPDAQDVDSFLHVAGDFPWDTLQFV